MERLARPAPLLLLGAFSETCRNFGRDEWLHRLSFLSKFAHLDNYITTKQHDHLFSQEPSRGATKPSNSSKSSVLSAERYPWIPSVPYYIVLIC